MNEDAVEYSLRCANSTTTGCSFAALDMVSKFNGIAPRVTIEAIHEAYKVINLEKAGLEKTRTISLPRDPGKSTFNMDVLAKMKQTKKEIDDIIRVAEAANKPTEDKPSKDIPQCPGAGSW